MREKPDAIDIFEQATAGSVFVVIAECGAGDRVEVAGLIQFDEFGNEVFISVIFSEAKTFFECMAYGFDVFVFAEDEGDDEPVVSYAHLAVRSVIAVEGCVLPARDVGGCPG